MTDATAPAPAPRRRRGLRILAWTAGIIGLVIALVLVSAAAFGIYTIRRSFPQTSGSISVSGLSAPVDVVRDALGVPTIYGDSFEDLAFAQGFVHAQDRFWEMDVRRHITSGRLSEMFGKSQVPTDSFLRTLGWRRVAEQEIPLLSDRSRQILEAYAAGVNAYLQDRPRADVSLEYSVLGLQNPSYEIEPWTPVDSVSWLKALAWDLRGNMADEVYRTIMAKSAGVDRTEQLFPPYPYDRNRPIVVGGSVVDGRFVGPSGTAQVSAAAYGPDAVPDEAVPALESVLVASAALEPWLGAPGKGIGSNSWAVSGAHTETGKPILANDPHLAPSMPSLWYQAGMRCRTITPDCDYEVAGWTMAGVPGVFIGHNDRIAWGFTNLGPDVTDLVLTKVEGESYVVDGQARPLRTRQETIKVAGGEPVTITVRETDDGPLISDVEKAGDTYDIVGRDAPVPAPGQDATAQPAPGRGDGYAVALRWTALTPSPTFDGFDAINRARTFDDFRTAATFVAVPAQNLLYADVDGNIGYQAPGRIPIRSGYDGRWPVPGWDSSYAWKGFIPFDALPTALNPPEGWIVTANQAVVGKDYPYFITDDWSYGARSQRIVDMLQERISRGDRLGVGDMIDMQFDSRNDTAAFVVPRILGLDGPDDAMALLDGWDFEQYQDSAAAAYYNAVWRQMINRMVNAATDSDRITASGDDQFGEVVRTIWDRPDDYWWDDKTTPEVETRDQTITVSLQAAADELAGLQGGDPQDWHWGGLHTLLLQNGTLGASGIAPIEMLFNRGPIETAGGSAIVNATGWTPSEGYQVDWVPSMRQVVDLSDFDSSTWVNLTGSSGHAFAANYSDQVEAWRTGKEYPWLWSPESISLAGVQTLTLTPGR